MKAYSTTVAAGLLFSLMTISSSAYADDYYCPSHDLVFDGMTVYGNILVADDCTLTGTTVHGNVLIYPGGSLDASDVYIEGNVQANEADFVRLWSSDPEYMKSKVFGDIQLDLTGSQLYEPIGELSYIYDAEIFGNVQLNKNYSPIDIARNYITGDIQAFLNYGRLQIQYNTVEGNIQVEENTDSVDLVENYVAGDVQVFYNYDDDYGDDAYGVLIEYNTIEGNLQCKENDPMPYGGYNDVKCNMEDQCEYLQYREDDGGEAGTTGSTGSGGGSTATANATSSSADALTDTSGGGVFGPFLSLLLCAVAMLRSRRRRMLVA